MSLLAVRIGLGWAPMRIWPSLASVCLGPFWGCEKIDYENFENKKTLQKQKMSVNNFRLALGFGGD